MKLKPTDIPEGEASVYLKRMRQEALRREEQERNNQGREEVRRRCCCCCMITKREAVMIITSLIVCLSMGSFFLAASLQNVSITDSSDLGQTVGYISGGVYYGASAIGSVAFPFISSCFGRVSVYFFALTSYAMLYAAMFVLNQYTIYLGSILAGAGGATLFILALKSIADNSPLEELQRNMSLFWAAVSIFNIINNMVNFFYIQSLKTITATVRISVYGALAGLTLVAMVLAVVLHKVYSLDEFSETEIHGNKIDPEIANGNIVLDNANPPECCNNKTISSNKHNIDPVESSITFKEKLTKRLQAIRVLGKRRSIWIIIVYQFFSGTLWGFNLKALPVSIGTTFEDRSIINLAGLVIGFSTLFGSFAFKKLRDLTDNFVCVGVMVFLGIISCTLSYLVFPYDANISLHPTGTPYITPESYHVILIAALLSLTDTGFNILGFSVAALMFEGDSSTSYSFLNVTFCIGNGVMFSLAGFINLHVYLIILVTLTVLTGLGYAFGLRKYLVQL